MKTEEDLSVHWFDNEFLKTSAFYADVENDLLILAKGGQYSSTLKNHPTKFLIKDFFEKRFTFYYPQQVIQTSITKTLKIIKEFEQKPKVTQTKNFDYLYEDDFNHFKSAPPELQKVVLISREEFSTENTKSSLLHFFYSALNFGTGYPYGFFNEQVGMIGATPELLFRMNGDVLSTFALAGTAKIEDGELLLKSLKDLHEHHLVVQDIAEKLQDHCTEITKGEVHLHPFKNITHLRTDFRAIIKSDSNPLELVNKMSPTAALGGYPMERSLEFLKATNYAQTFHQRVFGSSFGIISEKLVSVLVMIRNIQWKEDVFFIECGGGVVESSELTNELNEIRLKRSVIKKNYL